MRTKAYSSLESLQEDRPSALFKTLLYTGQLSKAAPLHVDSDLAAIHALAKGDFAGATAKLDELASATDAPPVQLCNNLAVALMYGGKLNEAIGILEATLAKNDRLWRDEQFLFNLCTMYELRTEKSASKKVALLREAAARGAHAGVK